MKPLKTRLASTAGSHADPRVRALAELVRDEYLEMADMALTVEQACILWRADRGALAPALHELVDRGVLRLSKGRYVLAR